MLSKGRKYAKSRNLWPIFGFCGLVGFFLWVCIRFFVVVVWLVWWGENLNLDHEDELR